MRAVVVELNNTKAAVLSDGGCVSIVRNNNYAIGQVIQLKQPKASIYKKISVCAASAAAVIFLSAGTWAYASPYSYVSMDVNPSIEFTVNRFDRVIKVKAVNDDGEEILKEISLDNLNNKDIEDAITTTVKEISEAGYFEGETEGGIVIATSSENTEKADELADELQVTVEAEAENNGEVVNVETISVPLERVEEAKALGVTPGKLNLVEKLQDAADDPNSIDVEEWLNKPVKEIMKATKEYRKADQIEDNTDSDSSAEAVDGNSSINEDTNELNNNTAANDQENEDKTIEQNQKDAEKAAEKAQKEAAKAEEQAKAAQEKADQKAQEAEKAADAKEKEEAKAAAEQAKAEAKAAQESAKAAKKAADDAQKAANKASGKTDKKESTKGQSSNSSKNQGTNKNTNSKQSSNKKSKVTSSPSGSSNKSEVNNSDSNDKGKNNNSNDTNADTEQDNNNIIAQDKGNN